MDSDKMYMIPYLSKELNLLGYPKLPFRINKRKKTTSSTRHSADRIKTDFSDTELEEQNSKQIDVYFDSKKMIVSLVSICFDLLKDIKSLNNFDSSHTNDYERIKFENNNLLKNVNFLKTELELRMRTIVDEKEKCRKLNIRLNEMQGKIKELERENLKIIQQTKSSKDIMKHKNKKIEQDLVHLHNLLWRKFNEIDVNYFPKNFKVLHLRQPDLNKLWSDVKFSGKNNEDVLKKALCIFQQNNELLLEDNSNLKTLLYVTVEEINYLVELVSDKMNLPCRKMDKKHLQKIFMNEKGLDVDGYKSFLKEQIDIFISIIHSFETCSFNVADGLFVCLTDVIRKLRDPVRS